MLFVESLASPLSPLILNWAKESILIDENNTNMSEIIIIFFILILNFRI